MSGWGAGFRGLAPRGLPNSNGLLTDHYLAPGPYANMPPAGNANLGRLYHATDLNGGTLFLSNGQQWFQVAAPAVLGGENAVVAVANGGTGATNIASAKAILGIPVSLYDRFADANNSGTSETTLYSDNIGANRLINNGDKVIAQYGGTFTGAVSATQELRLYFGPNGTNSDTKIFDTGALSLSTASPSWDMEITLIREASGNVRITVSIETSSTVLASSAQYTRITGLSLGSSQYLTLTGTAAGIAGASNQLTASMGYGQYVAA